MGSMTVSADMVMPISMVCPSTDMAICRSISKLMLRTSFIFSAASSITALGSLGAGPGSAWGEGVVFLPQAHRASSVHRTSRQASHFFAI